MLGCVDHYTQRPEREIFPRREEYGLLTSDDHWAALGLINLLANDTEWDDPYFGETFKWHHKEVTGTVRRGIIEAIRKQLRVEYLRK